MQQKLNENGSKLKEAVQAAVDRTVSHPTEVKFSQDGGRIYLEGMLFESEEAPLLARLRGIPGVREVECNCSRLGTLSNQDFDSRAEREFGYDPEFVYGHWSRWVRTGALAASIGLLALGNRIKGTFKGAFYTLAALLSARAITNRDLTHVVGGLVIPTLKLKRRIHLNAPVEDVFDFWKNFSNYPRFMSYIRKVALNERGLLHWVARGPGGALIQWDTAVHELLPNQRISWKSIPGSLIVSEGIVRLSGTPEDGTVLEITLSYAPPMGALGYAAALLLGFDPGLKIDEDLRVMETLIEDQVNNRGFQADSFRQVVL